MLGMAQASAQPSKNLNPTKGKTVVVPRLTAAKRMALLKPAMGTLVFQTDSTAGFYYFSGTAWLSLSQYNQPRNSQSLQNPLPAGTGLPDKVTTLAGRLTAGHADGSAASFFSPYGVAVDGEGTVYVADTYNHRIRAISPTGVVHVVAGGTKGYADGTSDAARFDTPTGIAIDSRGILYVADAGNDRIRQISPTGVVTTLAGSTQGFADGQGAAAAFHTPYALAVGLTGFLYVADAGNNRVCRISPDGLVVTLAGSLSGFNRPTGIAVDAADNVYVADSNNNCIRLISAKGSVSTLAGSTSGFADGPGVTARFNHPTSLAINAAGTLYVGEQGNNRVRIIGPGGEVSTLAGSGIATFANGIGQQAGFSLPMGLALDATGVLYVADMGNNCIRKVSFR